MKLRPFSIEDAPVILSWIKDKTAFRKWSADRYPVFPPEPDCMLGTWLSRASGKRKHYHSSGKRRIGLQTSRKLNRQILPKCPLHT